MNITFVAGVHGNERLPVQALDDIGVKFILGNPLAFERNVRFVDTDLNASFGMLKDSHEAKRAKEVLDSIPENSIVVDFHTTTAETPPFIILVDPTMLNFALILGIERIVLMSHSIKKGNALINYRKGVSIELGKHNDISAGYDLVKKIVIRLPKKEQIKKFQLFEVYDSIHEPGNYQNFKFSKKGNFVPILAGEKEYEKTGLYGLKARMVDNFT